MSSAQASANHAERPPAPRAITLMGVPVDVVTTEQAAGHIVASSLAGQGGWVVTPNLDILRRAFIDPDFRRLYDRATLRLADGMPLVWASRLRRTPLPGRSPGSDLIYVLSERAAAGGLSVYFLGGNPGAAEQAAVQLRERYPALVIAGVSCPASGFDADPVSLESVIRPVADASPAIVLVALGSPKQERVIERMRERLPNSWFLGIGITFSFVAGDIKRAPLWMQRTGIEWIHRLAQEPRRLARRYLVDGIPFALRLIVVSLLEGLRARRNP